MNTRTLTDRVKEELVHRLREGSYRNSNKLPPETEIAKDLGVSRNIVRSALSSLEREGFINRRRGVGTVVNHEVLNIKVRIDQADEFAGLIRAAGYKPKFAYYKVERIHSNDELAEILKGSPDEMVYHLILMMEANGRPVIYCEEYVRAVYLDNLSTEEVNKKEPVFQLLEKAGAEEIYLSIAGVKAVLAKEVDCKLCRIEPTEPVLSVDAVFYTFDGERLLYAKEYYMREMNDLSLVRQKLYGDETAP